ncbi:hypothetical protein ACPPVU_25640 [Mucilaginibacter sp. McL0603]|uniref:hypothetical protein n=1 Tax=Mucilaginibacter sp. McL0603 TaxID=3415670 RepID=UPI003CF3CBEA
MKKSLLKIAALCFLSLFFIAKSFGQTPLNDSSYLQTSITQTVSNFYKSIGQQSRLYDGHEYLPYDPHTKGNALFPYDAQGWEPGEVTYDGILYKNVPMMYDVYKDALVVLLYNKFTMFSLLKGRVHDFSFSNHYFIRLDADSINNDKSGIVSGYYDQLYGGKIEILARRSKTIQSAPNSSVLTLETFFTSTNDYYLRKGNIYYKIGSKSSILNVLKDKKSELQQYLKTNKIKYNANPDDAMAKIAAYYDHLTN